MAGRTNKQRMAGEIFERDKAFGNSPENSKGGKSWATKNIKGPYSPEGLEKEKDRRFFKEKGYDRNLENNGFRKEYIDHMMKDGKIDYFGDHPRFHKIAGRISRKTGLNLNRVDNPNDAEISNLLTNRPGVIGSGKGTNPEAPDAQIGQPFDSFGKGYEGVLMKTPYGVIDKGRVSGQSNAYDNRPFGFDDLNQINQTDPNAKNRSLTMHHEWGHSLGLRGDNSITNPNDPSVMSYNPGRKNRLTKRDFRSIKENFKDYL